MNALGVQTFADMYECDPAVLDDEQAVRKHMMDAARLAGATIVSECFHRFSPHGISGVLLIAESHLAIHTWPEHGYAAVDLFTCNRSIRPDACFAHLREAFRSRRHTTSTIFRG